MSNTDNKRFEVCGYEVGSETLGCFDTFEEAKKFAKSEKDWHKTIARDDEDFSVIEWKENGDSEEIWTTKCDN